MNYTAGKEVEGQERKREKDRLFFGGGSWDTKEFPALKTHSNGSRHDCKCLLWELIYTYRLSRDNSRGVYIIPVAYDWSQSITIHLDSLLSKSCSSLNNESRNLKRTYFLLFLLLAKSNIYASKCIIHYGKHHSGLEQPAVSLMKKML